MVSLETSIRFIRIQLAVDASIPELFGGVGGEAIYIGKSKKHIIYF